MQHHFVVIARNKGTPELRVSCKSYRVTQRRALLEQLRILIRTRVFKGLLVTVHAALSCRVNRKLKDY